MKVYPYRRPDGISDVLKAANYDDALAVFRDYLGAGVRFCEVEVPEEASWEEIAENKQARVTEFLGSHRCFVS